MSDELRYLASLHNAAAAGAASSLAPFLGVVPSSSRNDAAGPSPSKMALAPTIAPPSSLTAADAFRTLPHHHHNHPPGLPPPPPPSMNYFGGPPLTGTPLDLKHDHLSGALAPGQPMLPPFYYDPCFPSPFPYHDRFGGHLDINGARRKNATRETTAALKSWLFEHRKNPYPTKGEKIFLAIVTKMTLTQVSTWFANARRRLKKENKMTWSPRNRSGEDDDDLDDEDDDDPVNNNCNNNNNDQTTSSGNRGASSVNDKEHNHHRGSDRPLSSQSSLLLNDSEHSDAEISPRNDNNFHTFDHRIPPSSFIQNEKRKLDSSTLHVTTESTPVKRHKIWSIADTIVPSSSSSSNSETTPVPASMTNAAMASSNQQMLPFNLTFPPWHNMATAAAVAAMMGRTPPFLPPVVPHAQFFGGGLPPVAYNNVMVARNFLGAGTPLAFYQPPPPNLSQQDQHRVSAMDQHRTAPVSPISSTKSSSPIISKPSIKDATSRTTTPPTK